MLITALTLPALLERPDEAPRLSAGMFVIGYGMAFLLPLAGGAAWDASGAPAAAFAPLLACAVALLAASPALSREQVTSATGRS
jgi:CP family cyanate transporter-like MFS transporter